MRLIVAPKRVKATYKKETSILYTKI